MTGYQVLEDFAASTFRVKCMMLGKVAVSR
jgi:hypothetical protein